MPWNDHTKSAKPTNLKKNAILLYSSFSYEEEFYLNVFVRKTEGYTRKVIFKII